MKKVTPNFLLVFLLLLSIVQRAAPECRADHVLVAPVTGQSDWSILGPQIPSEYVTFGLDSITIREMPLKGNFHVSGEGVEITAIGSGILSADLDLIGTGSIWGSIVVAETVKGKEKVIFKGGFVGSTLGLLASGEIVLEGRGHYAGITIVVSFLETEPNSEVFILNGTLVDRQGDK